MILYEDLLDDYIDFNKNSRSHRKNSSSDKSELSKEKIKFKDKAKIFFSEVGVSFYMGFYITIFCFFSSFDSFSVLAKLLFSVLLELFLMFIIINFTYHPKSEKREHTNADIELFIQKFIRDTKSEYKWYIEDHIDDIIEWSEEKSKQKPDWYADLGLPENPVWSFIVFVGGFAIAQIQTGEKDKIIWGLVNIIFLFIIFVVAYFVRRPIYNIFFSRQIAAKELADDLKCAKLFLDAKRKDLNT